MNTRNVDDTSLLPSFRYRKALLNALPLWESEPRFTEIMGGIHYTAVTWPRCHVLYRTAMNACQLTGSVAEVGVYRGGSARILTEVFAEAGKTVNLFDTFEGMPQVEPDLDLHRQGDFSDTSVEKVESQLEGLSNYRILKGLFPETAEPVAGEKFCLAHIDVDIYKSVMDCCDFFYSRLVPGGVMVFDDYGEPTCPGARKAVDEFFATRRETPVYVPTGQCLIHKLPD